MNPLDNHELLLWAMQAGLTQDEIRQAVRGGIDAGRIRRHTIHDAEGDRLTLSLFSYLASCCILAVQRPGFSRRRASKTWYAEK